MAKRRTLEEARKHSEEFAKKEAEKKAAQEAAEAEEEEEYYEEPPSRRQRVASTAKKTGRAAKTGYRTAKKVNKTARKVVHGTVNPNIDHIFFITVLAILLVWIYRIPKIKGFFEALMKDDNEKSATQTQNSNMSNAATHAADVAKNAVQQQQHATNIVQNTMQDISQNNVFSAAIKSPAPAPVKKGVLYIRK